MTDRFEMNRRRFCITGAALADAIRASPRRAWASPRSTRNADDHPTPRPGITAATATSREQLERVPSVADAFEAVRAIPQIIDGPRCHCDCAGLPGFYSLLSCFEGPNAMALACPICPGEGRMAARLHKGGAMLNEIRAALDAKFG